MDISLETLERDAEDIYLQNRLSVAHVQRRLWLKCSLLASFLDNLCRAFMVDCFQMEEWITYFARFS